MYVAISFRASLHTVNLVGLFSGLSGAAVRRYFTVEGSELRIGVYESSNTLCMYLESDTGGSTLDNNLWVKFRIAVLNQKHPEKSEWKESAICTKTWNNSVLQFNKVSAWVRSGPAPIQTTHESLWQPSHLIRP